MEYASLKQEGTSIENTCARLPLASHKSKLSPAHTSIPNPSLQKFLLILLPDKVLPLHT